MRSRCKEIREQALDRGFNGVEALSWRIHSRSCPDCRTELYLLETLQQQAADRRYHLGRNEVAELFQAVREQQPAPSPLAFSWTWTLRLACLCLIFMVFAEFFRTEPEPSEVLRALPQTDGAGASLEPAEYATDTSGTEEPATPDVGQRPDVFPGAGLDQRLHDLRRCVDARRASLLQLIQQDLGERSPEDALDDKASPGPTLD